MTFITNNEITKQWDNCPNNFSLCSKRYYLDIFLKILKEFWGSQSLVNQNLLKICWTITRMRPKFREDFMYTLSTRWKRRSRPQIHWFIRTKRVALTTMYQLPVGIRCKMWPHRSSSMLRSRHDRVGTFTGLSQTERWETAGQIFSLVMRRRQVSVLVARMVHRPLTSMTSIISKSYRSRRKKSRWSLAIAFAPRIPSLDSWDRTWDPGIRSRTSMSFLLVTKR